MKALLLNGSPRKGNTCAALEALKRGFANIEDLEIKEINADDAGVSPCIACESCKPSGSCVFDDDTNDVIEAVMEADILVFASPVYWWGLTAQLKTIIDKFYCNIEGLKAKKKKVGLLLVGEAEQDNPQYRIIREQMECISDYLGWEMAFCKSYTAYYVGDLEKLTDATAEIEALWKTIS